jgi:hypothetical protein
MKESDSLFHVEKFSGYEHMDLVWAKDAKQNVFSKLFYVIEKANAIKR